MLFKLTLAGLRQKYLWGFSTVSSFLTRYTRGGLSVIKGVKRAYVGQIAGVYSIDRSLQTLAKLACVQHTGPCRIADVTVLVAESPILRMAFSNL